MIIFGKEHHFAFTVKAAREVNKMCPNGDIKRLTSVIGMDSDAHIDNMIRLALILKSAYDSIAKLEDLNYQSTELTAEQLENLRFDQFIELQTELMEAITAGFETKVELEESKKKVANQ